MKKLVIFDLDGTLLNTIADLAASTNHALAANGYPTHPTEEYRFFVGNGINKLFERALPEGEKTEANVLKIRQRFIPYYDVHCVDLTKPYPGIPELLRDLRDQNVQVAVASNKYDAAVQKIIHHYFGDIDFVAIEGQKEGVNVKPDPSVVFSILSQARVPKREVLYVGDSGVDMETARRACVDSVGVTWGFRPEKELVEYYAGTIIHQPGAILSLIEN